MAEEAKIPSKEEIRRLPRWAQVAFAARCARRVQPLFTAAWPDAPKRHVEAVEKAITQAEQAAGAHYAADADAHYAAAIRRDFARLAEATRRERWTNETPSAAGRGVAQGRVGSAA